MPYEMIMYAGIATAAIGFVIAAVIFFQLKIPSVISDLTGRTARREIEELQHGGRLRGANTAAFHGLGETAETNEGRGVGTEELKPGARSAQQAESDRQRAKKNRGAAGKKRSKTANRAAGRNSRAGQFAGSMNPHPGGQYSGQISAGGQFAGQNPAGSMNQNFSGQHAGNAGQNPAGGMNQNFGGQFAGDMAHYPGAAGTVSTSERDAEDSEAPTTLLGAAGTVSASERDADSEAPTTLLGSGAGRAVPSAADARTNNGLIIEVHDVVIHTDETLAGAS